MQRIRADEEEPTPERHSFIDTLAMVRDKKSFEREYGTWVGLIVAEDEVLRGLRERRGPPSVSLSNVRMGNMVDRRPSDVEQRVGHCTREGCRAWYQPAGSRS